MRVLTFFASVAALTVLLSGTASAWKGYPGASCLPYDNSIDIRRTTFGAINFEDFGTVIYCPAVRDIPAGGPGKIKAVSVRVTDQHGTEDGYCRVYSRTASGDVHDSQFKNWSGTGDFLLRFNDIDTSNWGNILIACRLPGADGSRRSYVRSFAVEEQ